MRRQFSLLPLLLLFVSTISFSQSEKIDSVGFFNDDQVIKMTLSTDMKNLVAKKMKMEDQPATVTITMPDGKSFNGNVNVRARGITRKETCNMPPLMVDFIKGSTSSLSSLHKLKLVCGCSSSSDEERLALKEFLVYRIYNLITDMSFRVRLAHITYEDSKGKRKPFTQYGFFIEDVDVLAKRNGCKELNNIAVNTVNTNRELMAIVDLFQYMVGNTDWSVPNLHNTKLIQKKGEPSSAPYVIPYDFDYAGLVTAYYAVPSEILNIEKVTDRLYRGYPRSMEELHIAIGVFNKQKESVYKLIAAFTPLADRYKKEVTDYIDEFYKIINDNKKVQYEFIDNARKN